MVERSVLNSGTSCPNNHENYILIFLSVVAIGRTLIPRYFRSIFDGGVSELYFHLKLAKESFHNPTITLDCDQCTMVTHHTVKPMFTKVFFIVLGLFLFF